MAADRTGEQGDRDRVLGVTPFGWQAPRLVVAVERAGGLGVLDLGRDRGRALASLAEVARWWQGSFGVRLPAGCPVRSHELPVGVDTVVIDSPVLADLQSEYRRPGRRMLAEVVDAHEAHMAVRLGVDGLIARGSEAGGRIGDLTTFLLIQRLTADPELDVPVWAAGGIGLHTAAAAVAGGAHGVVLDAQLALVAEMDLPGDVASAIAAMDGSETTLTGGHRVYTRPDLPELRGAELGAAGLRGQLLPIGQDGAFAGSLAGTYKTAGGVIRAVREQLAAHLAAAVRSAPLAPEPHPAGRTYPILQGPMTRVSDRALFAAAVAQDGGLPFLALALMDGEEVRRLLTDTAERLGDRPWGVGMLEFAPSEVKEAQLAAVYEIRPPYALIAGGRPSQAASLEAAGIATFLHVPSPGLLRRYLDEGARRFVFEGSECGGHVGPRASFPLWESQLEILTAFDAPQELSIAFAGGIHDERSAAMVAALAGPLAERGADIRVLMGTSYLFTHEAVAAGAILPGFQRAALECAGTVLLETSPGHSTRCADTPYAAVFAAERARMELAGTDRRTMWRQLEELNLGRLRIASKGLRRDGDHLGVVEDTEQRRDGMYMLGQVAGLRTTTTSIVGLHELVTTGATCFLAERAEELGIGTEPDQAEAIDIAIVGIGCVFPGAKDAQEYWANIIGGVDSLTEVPIERWDPALYHDGKGAALPRWGGFLPDIPFDALGYGIPPNSLGSVEPMQLLALEVAARALADAGYADRPFDRSRTSVFFAAQAGSDLGAAYNLRAHLPLYFGEVPAELDEQLPRLTEDSFPGVLTNVIAGRIANRLNLGGSNYTVDAACAASLAALDTACKELASGTSDMVLCGGADTHNGISDYLLFSAVHALSPTGRSAAFDTEADGIALGEGVGCLVLKRLADAERDGDRVYAVIKSVAGSSDGRSLGLTAPRVEGQRLAMDRAYRRAGVSPAQVGLVEAHGTGTSVGDRTELATLTETFKAAGALPGSCTLGSVKSQIGHTKCAAGLAGLIKTAYALHTGVRPGTLHLDRPGGAWDAETSPFSFDDRARPWAVPAGERYAGVSGFGFGGANFHAVLAGYDGAPEPVSGLAEWPAELFLIRGADRAAACAELDRLASLIGPGVRLRDLARTFAIGQGPVQFALVATGLDDLTGKLAAAREFRTGAGVFVAGSAEPGAVAFLFPGQSSQRPGMLGDLFVAFPRLQRLLHLAGGRYGEAMFPPATFTAEQAQRQQAVVTDTRIAQPALGIAGLAMHALLTGVGVRPDMAGGHSYGELVALCAAGVFGDTDLITLSAARADAVLAAAGDEPGTMAAVAAPSHEVRAVLAGHRVAIANHNAPRQTVISGPVAAIDAAVAALAGCGVSAQRIPVACAFHSPLVAGAAQVLRAELDLRDLRAPAFPVWSNTTAAPYAADIETIRATLAGQVAAPVRFVEQIEAMYAAGARVFVEAGPGRALTRLVGKILGDLPHTAVCCDVPGEAPHGLHRLLLALAELAAAGVPVDPAPLLAGRDTRVVTGTQARPGWVVNGHLVRTADGQYPDNALRPARRVGPPTAPVLPGPDRDATVLEYLRTTRELVAAQRDVLLGYLGATGPALPSLPPVPSVPAPRPAVVAAEIEPAEVSQVRLGPEEIRAVVLSVIGSRTGYPIEMLAEDLDLEADLSIDSIKRTEIIGELGERVGLTSRGTGQAEAIVERLARIKTIGEIVTWICCHLGTPALSAQIQPVGQPNAQVAAESAEPDAGGVRPRRHVVRLGDLPALPQHRPEPGRFAGQRFVIVDDGCGIALELADLLERYGAQVRTPVEPDGPADGLIHLGALRPGGGAVLPGAYAGIREALIGGARSLIVATGAGGSFGLRFDGSGAGDPSTGAGLRGLARTLTQEFPEVLVRAVDVDTKESPRAVADSLFAELLSEPGGPVEVGYAASGRRTLMVTSTGDVPEAALPLGPDGVVLLTGGARGITARVALAMAEATGCHLELIGRTPAPERPEDPEIAAAADETALRQALIAQGGRSPGEIEAATRRIRTEREIHDTLALLQGSAASVRYHVADVRDASAVRSIVQDVYARHGRLDGVVHGAGLLEDRLVRDKAPESFTRVYRTKVDGACALAAAVRPDVGFFVVFGSVSGVYGNRGQADYAAANDACDTLARVWRTRLQGRVLVADWGPWAGGGMVSPELAREYAGRGVALLEPGAAVAALLREIAAGEDVQVIFQ